MARGWEGQNGYGCTLSFSQSEVPCQASFQGSRVSPSPPFPSQRIQSTGADHADEGEDHAVEADGVDRGQPDREQNEGDE